MAGVCVALARTWQIDPLLVRVAFGLAGLSGGIGLVLYAVLWLWLPDAQGRRVIGQIAPAMARWPNSRVTWLAVIASIATFIALQRLTPFGFGPLLILGILIWLAKRQQRATAHRAPRDTAPAQALFARPDPSTDFGQAVLAWQARLQQVDSQPQGAPLPPAAPRPAALVAASTPASGPVATRRAKAPAKPRKRRASWWFTLLTLVVTAGVYTSVSSVTGTLLLPTVAALGVIALALLIGAFVGRPRLLVVVGLVLTAFLVPSAVIPADPTAPPLSERTWTQPSQISDVELAGQVLQLDLSQVVLTQNASFTVRAKASLVQLTLPAGVPVKVNYVLNGSSLEFTTTAPDGTQSRSNVAGRRQGSWQNTVGSGPVLTITIDLTYSLGHLR